MHPPSADLDHEQHTEPPQQRRVDTREVAGDDPCGSERMNSIQVGPVRSRVGSMPAAVRTLHTVDAATPWPRRATSPWIRRYSHVMFSLARRMMSWRSSGSTGGRPGLRAGGWVQWRAMRRRCQPIAVAGFTMKKTSARRGQSNAPASTARIVRSRRGPWPLHRTRPARCRSDPRRPAPGPATTPDQLARMSFRHAQV